MNRGIEFKKPRIDIIMKKSERLGEWVFYPVILLAFLYPVNINMVSLAIPLFFYRQGISTELIGVLSAGTTFTYTLSPILLSRLSEKLPRKVSIIIALTGTLLAQLIFYITLEPIPFLIARFTEGFIMGLYWTNLQSAISDNVFHDHKKLAARYNISWNFGVIFGFWLGALLTFIYNDLIHIFLISPIIILITLIIAIATFQEPKKISFRALQKRDISQETIQEARSDIYDLKMKEIKEIEFPKLYPVFLIIIFSLTRATINFIFPIKSDVLGFGTYTIYIAQSFFALSQSFSMLAASLFSTKYLKKLPQIMSFLLIILVALMGINRNYYIFIILFLIIGICTGIIYGVCLRLILILNMKNQTSIYSGILESVIGLSFLIAPISSGFIANINLNLPFYILSFLLVGINCSILLFINKKIIISDALQNS
jgi:MFS family permease